MSDLPVRVIQADPKEVPNHENEWTLVEYDGYRVGIGPAVRGFSVDGGQVMMLPVNKKGMRAQIVTKDVLDTMSIDSVFVCYTGGARYEAHQKRALKVLQMFWRAAEAGESAESLRFMIDMIELLDGADEPADIVPDGDHRQRGNE